MAKIKFVAIQAKTINLYKNTRSKLLKYCAKVCSVWPTHHCILISVLKTSGWQTLNLSLKLAHTGWTSTINVRVEDNGKVLLYLLLLTYLESLFLVKRSIVAILLPLHLNKHNCRHRTFLSVDNTKIKTNVSNCNKTYVRLIRLYFDPSILISKLRFCIIYFPPNGLACTICFRI